MDDTHVQRLEALDVFAGGQLRLQSGLAKVFADITGGSAHGADTVNRKCSPINVAVGGVSGGVPALSGAGIRSTPRPSHVRICHRRRHRPEHTLHHSRVLPVVVRLEEWLARVELGEDAACGPHVALTVPADVEHDLRPPVVARADDAAPCMISDDG